MSKTRELQRRVLVVDDEREICEQLQEALESAGWEVRTCLDGAAAETVIDNFKPTVVVLDLWMPKKGGLEVLSSLHDRRPWTQVIILTAHGNEDNTIECLNRHVFRFLRKVVSPLDVVEACEESLANIPSPILAFYKWFESQPDPNKVVFETASGREVSASQLMAEIQGQTPEGREFVEQVMGVAVELIAQRL